MFPTCISFEVLSMEDCRSLIFRNSCSLQKIEKTGNPFMKKQKKYAGYCDTIHIFRDKRNKKPKKIDLLSI